jgi:uncharacterized membrane protein YecN with MAPEG domain
MIITPIFSAIFAIFFVFLSIKVIKTRRNHKISMGTGQNKSVERAIRVHANFAEYVPFGIILIACLELNGAPWWLVAIPGLTLIVGRLIHAKGINIPPPDFSKRVLGMKFTFYTLITLVVLNLGWTLYKLID